MKKQIKNALIAILILIALIGNILTIQNIQKDQSPATTTQENMQNEKPSEPEKNPEPPRTRTPMDSPKINAKETILIVTFSSIVSLGVLYFIMELRTPRFFKNKDKVIIYILGNVILIYALSTLSLHFATNRERFIPHENDTPRENTSLNTEKKLEPGKINLKNFDEDITISKSGTYEFTGNFTHSIIVDAKDEEVNIKLNGVTIENDHTAIIIGLNAKKITIESMAGTENTLKDDGNSEYDGCIFSNAELVFKGTGKLTVNGNQKEGEGIATETQNITFEEGTYVIKANDDGINAGGDGGTITIDGGTIYIDADGDGIDSNKDAIINGGAIFTMGSANGSDAGIDTDDGFVINGGTLVALGNDMLEVPKENSRQNTLSFELDENIKKDTIVTLMKDNVPIVSFSADKKFKTIVISTPTLEKGDYSLHTGGTHTGKLEYGIYQNGKYTKGNLLKVGGADTFTISKTVTKYGTNTKKNK